MLQLAKGEKSQALLPFGLGLQDALRTARDLRIAAGVG